MPTRSTVSAGCISTPCCSSRARCASCAMSSAPTGSCSARITRSASATPILIFDRDGKFVGSWGEGLFRFPHAIRIVRENGRDVVWLCDEHHEQFYKFTTDGKLLQTIGEKGKRSDTGVPEDDLSSQA